MRIVALIQARLGSKRFPRKVLAEVGGCRVIGWTRKATLRSQLTDDVRVISPLADQGEIGGFGWDGDENDVAGRFAAYVGGTDAFVRICADSPLIHPHLIDLAVACYRVDPVEMVQLHGFPTGQQVQVFNTEWFLEQYKTMTPGQKEHPGLGLSGDTPQVLKHPRMVVDYPDDLINIEMIMRKLGRPHWEVSWPELLRVAKECDMEAHVA